MECYELFSVLLQSLVKESEITRVMKKVAEWLKVANEVQMMCNAHIRTHAHTNTSYICSVTIILMSIMCLYINPLISF